MQRKTRDTQQQWEFGEPPRGRWQDDPPRHTPPSAASEAVKLVQHLIESHQRRQRNYLLGAIALGLCAWGAAENACTKLRALPEGQELRSVLPLQSTPTLVPTTTATPTPVVRKAASTPKLAPLAYRRAPNYVEYTGPISGHEPPGPEIHLTLSEIKGYKQ